MTQVTQANVLETDPGNPSGSVSLSVSVVFPPEMARPDLVLDTLGKDSRVFMNSGDRALRVSVEAYFPLNQDSTTLAEVAVLPAYTLLFAYTDGAGVVLRQETLAITNKCTWSYERSLGGRPTERLDLAIPMG